MCQVVLAGYLELGRCLWHLGRWPAGLDWLQAGRPGVCGDALLFLLIPFVQRQCGWEHAAEILQVG